MSRWLGPADAIDELLLSATRRAGARRRLRPRPPPARARAAWHLRARRRPLAVAVELARNRGAQAIVGSIFDHVPGAGAWRTALLLDGNIGIGGAPERLLSRVGSLLATGGDVLVELDPPGTTTETLTARLESAHGASAPFRWAWVAFDDIATVAAAAGYLVDGRWRHGDRWFARLTSHGVR